MTDYERGYKDGIADGMAEAALPNIIDNGDKIDGYVYRYKTDSEGVPYINIDCVRAMLRKATDQPVDGWINIDDKLPTIDEQVMVYIKNPDDYHNNIELAYLSDKSDDEFPYWVFDDNSRFYSTRFRYVTHWQPLPEPSETKNMNLSDREKIKKFLQQYSMCEGTVKLECSEMKQIVEWLTELGERCGVIPSPFTVGGWVLFYRDDTPISVYRVIDISDSCIRLSGWACFDIHGNHYNDDFGYRFTYIRPIDANTAMKYVEKGLYIMDEDKDILLCEIESTTI